MACGNSKRHASGASYTPRAREVRREDVLATTLRAKCSRFGRGLYGKSYGIPVNVCGGTEKCASPGECRMGNVCAPASASALTVMARKADGTIDTRPPEVVSCCPQ
jgi:hypothetical protein